MDATFEKDETKNSDEAIIDLYSKLRQGEKVPVDAAKEFVRMRLFERRRYDLAAVGRYKFNKKLDVCERLLGCKIAEKIKVDGKVVKTFTETEQENATSETVEVVLTGLKPGMKIEAEAKCNLMGSKKGKLTLN